MKTQLLYLDPHDDAASTREKLRWVQADRVVLVWPSHGRVLQRRVDLALLTREASRQAAQLGILSHDPDVRAHARALHLPLFDDLDSIPPEAWPASRTSPAALPSRDVRPTPTLVRPPRATAGTRRRWDDARRAAWMSVVILALLALSIVVGPAAVIELSPRAIEVQTEVLIAMATDPVDDERTVWIPARRLQAQVGGELRQLTQGSVPADTEVAGGFALFTNRQETEVIVPEGTGLRTLGAEAVRFVTTEETLVPAGAGSEVLVPIRAADAGNQGNVPAEEIGAIEGVLGLSLGVTNPEATAGGVTALQPGVTPADLTRAQDALRLQLLQEANARLLDMLGDGEALAPDSVKVARVVSSQHRPDVGEASESILAAQEVVVEALAFDDERLSEAGRTALEKAGETGETIVPTSIRVDLVPSPGWTTPETGVYRATVSGLSFSSVDDPSLTGPLAGRDVAQATEMLAGQAEWESPPVVRIWPRWWPRLPLLPWRIQLAWTPGSR